MRSIFAQQQKYNNNNNPEDLQSQFGTEYFLTCLNNTRHAVKYPLYLASVICVDPIPDYYRRICKIYLIIDTAFLPPREKKRGKISARMLITHCVTHYTNKTKKMSIINQFSFKPS